MTGARPKVSVIIAAHGRPDELRETLGALRRQTHRPLEVIVVDDASPEPLAPIVREEWPDAVLIRHEQSMGAHVSRSIAMERSSGDYILTLDDDSNPAQPDTVAKAVEVFATDNRLGMLAFYIDEGREPLPAPPGGERRYVFDFVNCGQMMRKQVAREVGGYRDFYYYYAEETDFAWRVIDRGWHILYAPDLMVRHRRSPVGRRRGRIVGYRLRNTLWTLVLNVPFPRLLVALPFKVAGGVLEIIRLREWKWGAWALGSFLRGIPRTLRERSPVSRTTLRRMDALKFRWVTDASAMDSSPPVGLRERLRWYRRIWNRRQRFSHAADSSQEEGGAHLFAIRADDEPGKEGA